MDALNAETQASFTPALALDRLRRGNQRFLAGSPVRRDIQAMIQQTGAGQWPVAAVLGCIDSRVPAELVFDQGIGDLFSVRVAGNVINEDVLGSLEFACKLAGARLIVVLGHTRCGAVNGACDGVHLGHLGGLLGKLGPALDGVSGEFDESERSSANADFANAVTRRNVMLTAASIPVRSRELAALIDAGKLAVVGGLYDVSSGVVEFLNEV